MLHNLVNKIKYLQNNKIMQDGATSLMLLHRVLHTNLIAIRHLHHRNRRTDQRFPCKSPQLGTFVSLLMHDPPCAGAEDGSRK
jgi:hypothetical protein